MDNVKALDSLVSGASRISVSVHIHPDGDALGSGLALVGYLSSLRGKDAVLIVPEPVPESLSFMTRRFGEGSVAVFSADEAGASERIAASDLLFCLDCSSFSRSGEAMESLLRASKAPKVLIDHHLNPDAGTFSLVFSEMEVSSTCELLFGILKYMPDVDGDLKKLPLRCLESLLTGMTTDTNNFANSVFPGTMDMAAELMAAGVDRDGILSNLYQSYRENRLRLMGYLLDRKLVITPEGVAYMILDGKTQKEFDFRQGESEGFVNLPLAAANVRMSILLTEEKDRFRVSVRSKQGVSANLFTRLFFDGGGHEMAAGGKLVFGGNIDSPEDAEAYILKVSREFFDR